jgi:hypothetical protein
MDCEVKGNILTITHETLETNTKYTLTLEDGCVSNLAGDPSPKYITTFTTTKFSPYVIPQVISTIPAKNALNVSLYNPIKIKFNCPIEIAVNDKKLISSKGTNVPILSTANGNTLTITFAHHLELGTKYTLTLFDACVTNLIGDRSSKYVTSFTTTNIRSSIIIPSSIKANSMTMRNATNDLRYTVTNIGTGTAYNYNIKIYLTSNKSLNGTKYLVGNQLIKSLAPGHSLNLDSNIFVPSKVPLSKFYLAVVANKAGYSYIKTIIIPYTTKR